MKSSLLWMIMGLFFFSQPCLQATETTSSLQKPALSSTSSTPLPSSKSSARPIRVVTSFYPMYVATLNVVGTPHLASIQVTNLTAASTGCLHDYQLTPQDLKTLSQADILIISGAGMEPFLDKIAQQLPKLQVIDVSQHLKLLEAHEEHHHHHDHAEGEHEVDSHTWMSVANMIVEVETIAEAFEKMDPAHAALYQANAAIYIKKLDALRQHLQQKLQTLPHRQMINFHDAFAYFAQEFNLQILAAIEIEPGAQPSAQELTQVIKLLRTHPQAALFTEPTSPQGSADAIARETGRKVYQLDPLTSGPLDPTQARDSYLNGMEKNLQTLEEALH